MFRTVLCFSSLCRLTQPLCREVALVNRPKNGLPGKERAIAPLMRQLASLPTSKR
jgi:hypothetical protein